LRKTNKLPIRILILLLNLKKKRIFVPCFSLAAKEAEESQALAVNGVHFPLKN
jgi:hypothetical protein